MTHTEIREHWLTWSLVPMVFPRGDFGITWWRNNYRRASCTVFSVLQSLRGGQRPPTKSLFSDALLGSLGWTNTMWRVLSSLRTKYLLQAKHFHLWPRWFWALCSRYLCSVAMFSWQSVHVYSTLFILIWEWSSRLRSRGVTRVSRGESDVVRRARFVTS